MIFTHDIMPTLLLKQLYRGSRILAGSPYHKWV
ncbi:MAG: 23S rRNA (pseudouridine(1915)-N(3))-methyltransferase RlmH [Synergistaceae bacterium]|nr:23S rRNA (pseudouridine(1915)-N(3))-methyltransferase RlmH [Synergistaceae bacterium]